MLYVHAALLASSYVIILKFNQLSALMDSLYKMQMHENERDVKYSQPSTVFPKRIILSLSTSNIAILTTLHLFLILISFFASYTHFLIPLSSSLIYM